VRLGSRGLREVNGRVERIVEDDVRAAVRRRALVVTAQSVLIAAAMATAAWLLPA
jgi:uncharacterized membrane protein